MPLVEQDILAAYAWHIYLLDSRHPIQQSDLQYVNAVLCFAYGRIGRARTLELIGPIEANRIHLIAGGDDVPVPPSHNWQQLLADHPEP